MNMTLKISEVRNQVLLRKVQLTSIIHRLQVLVWSYRKHFEAQILRQQSGEHLDPDTQEPELGKQMCRKKANRKSG